MKLKDLFENEKQHPGFLTDPEKIKQWLDDQGVNHYTILPDGKVDVEGDVLFYDHSLQYILVQFNKVTGYVSCYNHMHLKSLIGCPSYVGGDFYCRGNNSLTSLVGSPRKINGRCYCGSNYNLKTLKGGPKWVKNYFDCSKNPKLETLDYAPLYVGGDFRCDESFTQEDIPFTDLKGKFYNET